MLLPFAKYHAQGNSYVVVDGRRWPGLPQHVVALCSPRVGLGADGLLVVSPHPNLPQHFCVRIFNPDGSEAEKSGNGLRIAGRWLLDSGQISQAMPLHLVLAHGEICTLVWGKAAWLGTKLTVAQRQDRYLAEMAMGMACFSPAALGWQGLAGTSTLRQCLQWRGHTLCVHGISVGNPHLLMMAQDTAYRTWRHCAPSLSKHPQFIGGINVHWLRVVTPQHLQLSIFERGVGPTSASGTSSCAAAALVVALGIAQAGLPIRVQTKGGSVWVVVDGDYRLQLLGSTRFIGRGVIRMKKLP